MIIRSPTLNDVLSPPAAFDRRRFLIPRNFSATTPEELRLITGIEGLLVTVSFSFVFDESFRSFRKFNLKKKNQSNY